MRGKQRGGGGGGERERQAHLDRAVGTAGRAAGLERDDGVHLGVDVDAAAGDVLAGEQVVGKGDSLAPVEGLYKKVDQ